MAKWEQSGAQWYYCGFVDPHTVTTIEAHRDCTVVMCIGGIRVNRQAFRKGDCVTFSGCFTRVVVEDGPVDAIVPTSHWSPDNRPERLRLCLETKMETIASDDPTVTIELGRLCLASVVLERDNLESASVTLMHGTERPIAASRAVNGRCTLSFPSLPYLAKVELAHATATGGSGPVTMTATYVNALREDGNPLYC